MKNSAHTQVTNSETNSETILENNKLILEFMDFKPTKTFGQYSASDGIYFSCNYDTQEEVVNAYAEYAKYATDWDWLMVVEEKIEKLGYLFEIFGRSVSVHKKNGEFIVDISAKDHETKIEAVYSAVVEFVQWYINESKSGDKLIAEFLGAIPNHDGEYEMYQFLPHLEDTFTSKHFYFVSEMLFQSDWNWLMPVVVKIEKIFPINEIYEMEDFLLIRDELCTGRIDTSFGSVVNFIKWYNAKITKL